MIPSCTLTLGGLEYRLYFSKFISHTCAHPPWSRKIFCLRFFCKSPRRCSFSCRVWIGSRNLKIRSRLGVIRVLKSFHYVILHIFAFRAHFRALFFVFHGRFGLPKSRRNFWVYSRDVFQHFCKYGAPTDFWHFRFFAFLTRFFGSFSFFRQLAPQTLIVWGGCRFRPFLQSRNPCLFLTIAVYIEC